MSKIWNFISFVVMGIFNKFIKIWGFLRFIYSKFIKINKWPFQQVQKWEIGFFQEMIALTGTFLVMLGGYLVTGILVFLFFYHGYRFIDTMSFPHVDKKLMAEIQTLSPDSKDSDKGRVIFHALTNQMHRELKTFLGWTANDLIGTQILSRRASREEGIRYATQFIGSLLYQNVTSLGTKDKSSEKLLLAFTSDFVVPSDQWQFNLNNAEGYYKDGIEKIEDYVNDLRTGKNNARFNMKRDDMSGILYRIANDQYGLVEVQKRLKNEDSNAKNDIYFAQGFALELRDFLTALFKAEPSYISGTEDNVHKLMTTLDWICEFDPYMVMIANHGSSMFADHPSRITNYFDLVQNGLDQIAGHITGKGK